MDKQNRSGDTFKCCNCGMVMSADHNAALNIRDRMDDDDIQTWMHPKHVREVLKRRLEGSSTTARSTVSGKTPDTARRSTHVGHSESDTRG